MERINQLMQEHRKAYAEIISIEKSLETDGEKAKRIIDFFDSELKSHFKYEEENIFTSDSSSTELLSQHHLIYAIISDMKSHPQEHKENISEFIEVMKDHIKKEDIYFDELDNRSGIMLAILVIILIIFAALFYLS